jgi:NADH-quinone oxidoreductase subunit E
MAQIGKDYYEDLTAEGFGELLDAFARGEVPRPGPQNGRYASEPKGALTSLDGGKPSHAANASVTLAEALGDTIARIDGGEMPPAEATGGEAGPSTPASEPSDHGEAVEPRRPHGLPAPRAGAQDDLKEIKGIGPRLEELLHEVGVYHHDQIAAWGPPEVAWVDENVEGVAGRATRDGWVEQARQLVEEGETPFTDKRTGQD